MFCVFLAGQVRSTLRKFLNSIFIIIENQPKHVLAIARHVLTDFLTPGGGLINVSQCTKSVSYRQEVSRYFGPI